MYLPNRWVSDLFCVSFSSTHSRSCRAHSSLDTVPYAIGAPGAPSHSTCSARRGLGSATVLCAACGCFLCRDYVVWCLRIIVFRFYL